MADWNAGQYLKFEDERTRPAADLLSRVPLADAEHCIDIGCGPGNSTALLVERFPNARIEGLDSSPDMLAKARERYPQVSFERGDIATWRSEARYDLIFANAVLQWVHDHKSLLPRLVGSLEADGCLAIQMPNNMNEPSHRLMQQVAEQGPWADTLSSAVGARQPVGSVETYYDSLTRAGCSVDIWQTTYFHPLEGAGAIVEWFKSTGLRPYLDPLSREHRERYLEQYLTAVEQAYPAHADGKVLLPFPRLFMIARRR